MFNIRMDQLVIALSIANAVVVHTVVRIAGGQGGFVI
jgi:hypothetical protein